MAKRAFDILAAAVGLILLAPILVVLAALVRISSPGPALFRQKRVGRNARDFTLYKFRSMTVRPEACKGQFDAGDASRVTRVGKFLRKTKLDELPQLFNVLLGDMSLVGPRPEVRKWVQAYPQRWQKVLTVRPGITDPASIRFRNEEEILAASPDPQRTYREEILPRKLDLYEQYVDRAWLGGDLALIFRTLAAVLIPSSGKTQQESRS
jgi:lipopolysaccharide/colanic/teichoic acid biosynthesis glycosyltransferase